MDLGSITDLNFGQIASLFTDSDTITNFIQLVSPQPVDQFSQTKLHWKVPNKGYLYIYRMYKSDNK